MQQPVLYKKSFISPVWLLPFVAFCIGAWLLYSSYRDAGINITIHFESATGITPGKTQVIYKGIPVGTVKDVSVDTDLEGVNLHVEMDRNTEYGLVEDTKFWIVRPEVSAGRISGLETLLGGSYIGVKKGKSTKQVRSYIGLKEPPPVDADTPGLHLTLKTPSLYSLQRGSNVYSKNLQIGQVEEYRLEADGTITLKLFIQPEFSHLVRKDTRFWNSSGLSVSGDLQTGLTVNMESLASLIYGGIACATPHQKKNSPLAESGQSFPLYKDFEAAEYGIPMKLQLASGDDIVAGKTKVLFRGLKAGVVNHLDINDDSFHTVTASILLDPRAEVILRQNTRFWVIRPQVSIEGIKNLETLITGAYITFQPGDGEFRDSFLIETTPMPIPTLRPGRHFLLEADDSGSLKIGTPVLFRKISVGEVTDITLTEDGRKVRTRILVYQPFDHLVQENSIFWNVSGVQVNASLSDFKINLSSMRTMLAGGITFFNPPADKGKDPIGAKAGTVFPLYEGYHEAVKQEAGLQPRGLALQVRSNAPVDVGIGSPVLFNNIKVGEVMDLSLPGKGHQVLIDIRIYEKFRHLVNNSSRFYNASGIKAEASLQGIAVETGPLEAIVNGGIAFITPKTVDKLNTEKPLLLYGNRREAVHADDLHLRLYLRSAAGIGNQTKIRYQGAEIGRIVDLHFDENFSQVVARAVVQQKARSLFRQNTLLYLVGPDIGLSGINNPETLLSGAYISLRPGSGQPCDQFTVLPHSPEGKIVHGGLNIVLESDFLGSLNPGSPVYYRQVPVGLITSYLLSPTGQQVWLSANIKPEYQFLVHRGTRFWNVSGIEVSGGIFSGMTVNTESVEALVRGGVAFATPEGDAMGEPAQNGDHFSLAPKPEVEWKKWSPQFTETDAENSEFEESTEKTPEDVVRKSLEN